MGEYARSLAIAQAAKRRWPQADIRFMLSRAAPYAESAPFPATLLDSSPTFHSPAVVQVLESWRPHVAIFDNAGRTDQLRSARRCGSRVVYISARRRQRRKAFRLRWMRVIDEHWIAYPDFIAGKLGWLERLKLKYLRRPQVRFLDVILARHPPGDGRGGPCGVLERLGCIAGGYTLVVAGGGTGHPGALDAMATFERAARALAEAGAEVVFVGRAAAPGANRLHLTGALPQSELAELMDGARLIVTNGGSTLLQAIACGKPCIAAPIAGDQRDRIRRCAAAGAAQAAALDATDILAHASALLGDDARREALGRRAAGLGLADGVDVALRALAGLVKPGPE